MEEPNVQLAVPFFRVREMAASLRFYVEGLGFRMTKHWYHEGAVRWCWLELGAAAVMLQQCLPEQPVGGAGVTISFQCRDALAIYREARARGVEAEEPFVGNGMWVTVMLDPDGYRLEFESLTDVAEETKLGEWAG